MFKGEYIFDPVYEPLVTEIVKTVFTDALMAGFNVILDETHITREKRARWFRQLEEYRLPINPEIICVWFTENEKNLEYHMRDSRGYTNIKWNQGTK